MAIEGNVREDGGNGGNNFRKQIGLFTGSVIAINPDAEEYKSLLGIELKEDSKNTEYLGVNKDGNSYLRVDFWIEENENKQKFKITYFLEDKERENKDGTKKQYINNIGSCSWAASPNDLQAWFTKRDYRVANSGEEDFYAFLKVWLGKLDQWDENTDLSLSWKKLMKGNVKELKDLIGGSLTIPILALAIVKTKVVTDSDTNEESIKHYQNVWNKMIMSAESLKFFNNADYSNEGIVNSFKNKKTKDLKEHEKFVLAISGQFGCKDSYVLKPLQDFDANEFIVGTDDIKKSGEGEDLPF